MQSRFLIYTIVIALSVAAIAGVVQLGERWHPSGGSAAVATSAAPAEDSAATALGRPLALLIVQLLVIVLATQLAGSIATRLRQPAVVGEIAAGLMLGPSLLGQVSPPPRRFSSLTRRSVSCSFSVSSESSSSCSAWVWKSTSAT